MILVDAFKGIASVNTRHPDTRQIVKDSQGRVTAMKFTARKVLTGSSTEALL